MTSDRKEGGKRLVTLRLKGSPQTSAMALRVPKEAKLLSLDFRGQHVVASKEWSGNTTVSCLSRDCAGMELTLTLGNTGPLKLVYAEQRYGLPPFGDALKAARPANAMPSQSGDEINLANTVTLK